MELMSEQGPWLSHFTDGEREGPERALGMRLLNRVNFPTPAPSSLPLGTRSVVRKMNLFW